MPAHTDTDMVSNPVGQSMDSVKRLYSEGSFLKHVSEVASKSLRMQLQADVPPSDGWTYVESSLHKNASASSFVLEEAVLHESGSLQQTADFSRRLASLWENLSQLGGHTPKDVALLNAAISYELAGFQANASCMAKQYDAMTDVPKSDLGRLTAILLQRKFMKLRKECVRLVKEPGADHDGSIIERLGMAVAASAMLDYCDFFMSGLDSNLDDAKAKLENAEEMFSKTGMYANSNLVHSIKSLVVAMQSRSTWSCLAKHRGNFTWNRYLRLLARGTGLPIAENRSVSELWPSQTRAIKNGLLESDSSKIIRMPTSSGKTRIAEMAIINALTKHPGSKCVYMAPYNALVAELEDTLIPIFNDMGLGVSSITGTYEDDPFDAGMISNNDLIIATPEKMDLLLRSRPKSFDKVSLFILDEGHAVSLPRRGIKMELLLTRLKMRFPGARFMVLSAVLAEQTMKEFLEWMRGGRDDLIADDWTPTMKRCAKFTWDASDCGLLEYEQDPQDGQVHNTANVPSVIMHREYRYKNPETGRMARRIFPSNAKNETAAELGFKFSAMGPVLIFSTSRKNVMSIARAIRCRVDLGVKTGKNIHHLNRPGSKSVEVAREWLGGGHEITALLEIGIAVHHGSLPDVLKRAIESDCRDKKFDIVVATNTLSQGVNLPIRTVIIHSCSRYESGVHAPIPPDEYWNLAGRAGRAGYETEGTVIHIVNSPRDAEDYDRYMRKRGGLDPTHGDLYRLLQRCVTHGINDDVKHLLDPEILGILAEENELGRANDRIDEILSGSLAACQAKDDKAVTKLSEAFKGIAAEVRNSVQDDALLRVFGSTGLHHTSCQIIFDAVQKHKDRVGRWLASSDHGDLASLTRLILDTANRLNETNNEDYAHAGDKSRMLELWMDGESMGSIAEREGLNMSEYGTTRFIDRYFGYYMPWITSCFIRIATHVLGIARNDVSPDVRYLPGMIRHGVPSPEADWAIRLGISSRMAAIRLGRKYLREVRDRDGDGFVDWLSSLEGEAISHDLKLAGNALENAIRVASRAGRNSFLADENTVDDVLSSPVRVTGVAYGNRQSTALSLQQGAAIMVQRDYDNMHDRNAIKLLHKGRELGFVPRAVAQCVAPIMDAGAGYDARVLSITDGDVPDIRIRMQASERPNGAMHPSS